MSPHRLRDLRLKIDALLRSPASRTWLLDQADLALGNLWSPGWGACPIRSDGSVAPDASPVQKATALLAFRELAFREVEFAVEGLGPAPWPDWRDNPAYAMKWGIAVGTMKDRFRPEHGCHIEDWLKEIEHALHESGIPTIPDDALRPARKKGETDTPPLEEFIFASSGKGYVIKGFGESGHLSGYKGLSVIARLIRTPREAVPMLELVNAGEQLKADKRSPQTVLDSKAKRDIKERWAELKGDLDRARRENNTVKADGIEKEIEELEREALRATGLGGKDRDLNNPFDKLRPMILNRLRAVYAALRKSDPPMPLVADHFEQSISSESGCFIYRPGPFVTSWKISGK